MIKASAFFCLLITLPILPVFKKKSKPPPHPLIGHAYYHCEKCHTLQGGMWGKASKGENKKFYSPSNKTCVHEWKGITKKEFKALAEKYYSVDWSKEDKFWQPKPKTVGQIIVVGNEVAPDSIFLYWLGLFSGQTFTDANLLAAENNLAWLNYLGLSATVKALEGDGEIKDIRVEVQETTISRIIFSLYVLVEREIEISLISYPDGLSWLDAVRQAEREIVISLISYPLKSFSPFTGRVPWEILSRSMKILTMIPPGTGIYFFTQAEAGPRPEPAHAR